MDEQVQGALMVALGAVAIRLGLTGGALSYIKAGYVPLLIAAGVVTLVLGVLTLVPALGVSKDPDPAEGPDDADGADHSEDTDHAEGTDHGHDHSRGPRIAWMLAAPLFAVILIAPPPLGSFAANRQNTVYVPQSFTWPALPDAVDGAVPLSLGDYTSRALYDSDLSLAGATVRLTGFASGVVDGGFILTRFALSCCAADGTAIDVEVRVEGAAPAIDQWLEVEGSWVNRDGHVVGDLTADPPIIDANAVVPIEQPTEPYEG